MKKLIFIDNDLHERSLEDVEYVQDKLEYWGGLSEDEVKNIQIISDFSRMDKDEAKKILFNPNNCICTWSMYTPNHYSSLYQLLNFLTSAGRNDVRDIIYLDASGKIKDALERNINETNVQSYAILNAIETNYIITSNEDGELVRLRVQLKGYNEDPFYLEKINFKELISK